MTIIVKEKILLINRIYGKYGQYKCTGSYSYQSLANWTWETGH